MADKKKLVRVVLVSQEWSRRCLIEQGVIWGHIQEQCRQVRGLCEHAGAVSLCLGFYEWVISEFTWCLGRYMYRGNPIWFWTSYSWTLCWDKLRVVSILFKSLHRQVAAVFMVSGKPYEQATAEHFAQASYAPCRFCSGFVWTSQCIGVEFRQVTDHGDYVQDCAESHVTTEHFCFEFLCELCKFVDWQYGEECFTQEGSCYMLRILPYILKYKPTRVLHISRPPNFES